ncbi:MAG: penicillin-binding protein 2 [Pseudomonadota bacterium]
MIRKPLRPLADIIAARIAGKNLDRIEQGNIRERRMQAEAQIIRKTRSRLWLLCGIFSMCFITIGTHMVGLSVSDPTEPKARIVGTSILSNRADIVDRNGRVLATNMETVSLYTHPYQITDPAGTAQKLANIFPNFDADRWAKRFANGKDFAWLKSHISPEEKQAVHDIGDPGLLFGPREMRLYPNGRLAAHILGGATFGDQGTHSAEVLGVAGIEKNHDIYLRDLDHQGAPLALSIDLTAQAALETALADGMFLMNAKAAAATLMDVHTGEVVAMASLPDFDPNHRPLPLLEGDQSDDPLFNRAVQGLYELGSTFKSFPIAQALELGVVAPDTLVDTKGPLQLGRFKVEDFDDYGPRLSVEKVLVKSSNIGTVHIANMIGSERQKAFLSDLGLLSPTDLEVIEAASGKPQYPSNWGEVYRGTIAYGHGVSTSQLHLAAAYAALVNGGTFIRPTLIKQQSPQQGHRVISSSVSRVITDMLRKVVTEGTARAGEVRGYAVGGKTGTADKPNPQGGYYEDKVIASFASVFPTHDPQYTLIVTLDEAVDTLADEPRRSAGYTAVPVAAEIIRRVAPLLGVRPVDSSLGQGVTVALN